MSTNKICKYVAKQTGEDEELVKQIVMFLFDFIRDVMKDEEDLHDILLHDLFRFLLKPRYKNNKQYKYSSK